MGRSDVRHKGGLMKDRFKKACEELTFPCTFKENGHIVTADFEGIKITIDTNTGQIFSESFGDGVTDLVERMVAKIYKEIAA